ncbi:Uncharacterised protein [Vibrio cholerae]|nr:Uncharacterised protein [Vibrio cholerae]
MNAGDVIWVSNKWTTNREQIKLIIFNRSSTRFCAKTTDTHQRF